MAATIVLDDSSTERIIAVGDTLIYKARVHASVGFGCVCDIVNPNVLRLADENTEFDHPEAIEAGMCGGDSANAVFVIEAIGEGNAMIAFQHLFRGKLERSTLINIVVV